MTATAVQICPRLTVLLSIILVQREYLLIETQGTDLHFDLILSLAETKTLVKVN
jgi:hypothetical protein